MEVDFFHNENTLKFFMCSNSRDSGGYFKYVHSLGKQKQLAKKNFLLFF